MDSPKFVVYKITNKINDKCYIGKTNCGLEKRWREHKSAAFNKKSNAYNYTLSKAIRKYGINNFIKDIIFVGFDAFILNIVESIFIKTFNSRINGYNSTDGGEGITGYKRISPPWNKGKVNVYSKETKALMGTGRKGKPSPTLGKKMSDSAKLKMSKAKKGKPLNNNCKKALEIYLQNAKGKKRAIEIGQKVSKTKSKPILAVNLESGIISFFKSSKEASLVTGFSRSHISFCINNKTTNTLYKFLKE